jgi:hypothetical protein
VNPYSIKIALRGISPMIWRRLRVQSNTSLADLHHIIQIAMGWDDYYLHYFHIFGEDYGVHRHGATCFRHNVSQVFVEDFGFDVGDRVTYTYNFFEDWLCDVRVEAIGPVVQPAPRCFGGSGRQGDSRYYKYDEYRVVLQVIDLVGAEDRGDRMDEFQRLVEHYDDIRFSRRLVNKQLKEPFPKQ